ncbi:MAG: outer membrane protein assembly factor BamA [Deltaproteobacteria bacterium]|nr:outer membrane protein assembly factor BamA [Deltaproteobacteria bacterium]
MRTIAVLFVFFVVLVVSRPTALAENLVERIEVHGAKRIEAETVRMQLRSKVGQPLDPIQVRDDIHAVWKLGVFADVRVDTQALPSGNLVLVVAVAERPALRKVLISGNDEIKLGKIDEVLDLKAGSVLDVSNVVKNRDKIAELYEHEGYYLASVDYELVPVGTTEVDIKYRIDEHAKIRVRDIEFVGNRAVSSKALREVMLTRPPNALSFITNTGTYQREALERDVVMLTAHYLDKGYATVKIGAPLLRLSRDKKFIHVSINVEEGPRFTFGTVDYRGDLLGTVQSHEKLTVLRGGATFSRSQVERDRKALEDHYQDQGYASANVTPKMRVDHKLNRIDLTFEVVRGKRAYIERIAIRGNAKTRDKVIRREMKISEGELFSGSKIDASRRRITALGYFQNVAVSTTRGTSDELVVVNVEVTERRTGTFQLGAGFSSQESFMAQGQIAQENFLGRGYSLALQAQISGLRRIFAFRFVEPYFLDTNWMFASELYNASRSFGSYARNATGGSLTWGYPLGDYARASMTYRLERVDITGGLGGVANFGAQSASLSGIEVGNLFRGGWTSSVRAALSWDSRNNRLFPTEGWYANAYAEYAGRATGSENQFVRWGGFLRRYKHLGGPFTLRLNGELGVTTSLDGRGVPLSERYLLGGIYDIRGYQPRSVGPTLWVPRPGDVGQPLQGMPLGGNLSLVLQAEIEFPLVKRLGISGVVFFDAGNAFNLEDRYCGRGATAADACFQSSNLLGGLRKSVGAGIRWMSPMGPLRFEWGIPLDLKPGETPAGLEFTIGTSF